MMIHLQRNNKNNHFHLHHLDFSALNIQEPNLPSPNDLSWATNDFNSTLEYQMKGVGGSDSRWGPRLCH